MNAALPENEADSPVVLLRGAPLTALPRDLYIPPDALEVFLESFSGPLDLLLYLIKRSEMDILDIPIAEITSQYMEYVELMRGIRLELAADYLLMAAYLAEIKSRMLLPRPPMPDDEASEDPRAELVRRLQVYAQFQSAAQRIEELAQLGRDFWAVTARRMIADRPLEPPALTLWDLMQALRSVQRRGALFEEHAVRQESLSVRERMTELLAWLGAPERLGQFVPFAHVLSPAEGRHGLVVTLMAILELIRLRDLQCHQNASFGPIYVRVA